MDYLVLKATHISFVIAWFAGLFYLPRIFVNLAMVESETERARLLLMANKLYRFMTPLGAIAIATGLGLWLHFGISGVITISDAFIFKRFSSSSMGI